MQKTPKDIAEQIVRLLNELTAQAENGGGGRKTQAASETKKSAKGAAGAINMLIDDGYFDTPKELPTIIERLKQIGHYHKPPTVSMNLLNLTKRRTLNRFKNKETNNWEYVLRK